MPIRKLMSLVSLIGLVLLIVSLIWWQQTYGFSIDLAKCVAVRDTVCKLGGLKAAFSDLPAYNPIAFWVGLIAFLGGAILKKIL